MLRAGVLRCDFEFGPHGVGDQGHMNVGIEGFLGEQSLVKPFQAPPMPLVRRITMQLQTHPLSDLSEGSSFDGRLFKGSRPSKDPFMIA